VLCFPQEKRISIRYRRSTAFLSLLIIVRSLPELVSPLNWTPVTCQWPHSQAAISAGQNPTSLSCPFASISSHLQSSPVLLLAVCQTLSCKWRVEWLRNCCTFCLCCYSTFSDEITAYATRPHIPEAPLPPPIQTNFTKPATSE